MLVGENETYFKPAIKTDQDKVPVGLPDNQIPFVANNGGNRQMGWATFPHFDTSEHYQNRE